MCRVLEVSVGGFYAWKKRPMCSRKREDGVLTEQIVDIFHHHRDAYGSPRVHSVLKDRGIHCGRKRVHRLMRAAGLVAHHRIHRVITTRANPQAQVVENVLNRQFQVNEPIGNGSQMSLTLPRPRAGCISRPCSIFTLVASWDGRWLQPLMRHWSNRLSAWQWLIANQRRVYCIIQTEGVNIPVKPTSRFSTSIESRSA